MNVCQRALWKDKDATSKMPLHCTILPVFCMDILAFSFLFKIQNFIDGLEEGQRRRFLLLMLNNGRGSLDYARRLLEISVTYCNKTSANSLSVIVAYPKEFSLVLQLSRTDSLRYITFEGLGSPGASTVISRGRH